MKKKSTLLFLSALIVAVASNAQINKGSVALGGNLNFSTSTSKNDVNKQTQSNVIISPSLLSFYKDNRAVGFNLSYSHFKSVPGGEFNSYGGGLFLRQYKTLGSGFYLFAQEALNYNYGKSSGDTSVKNIVSTASITANPGIAYNFNKKFQLEILFFNNLLSAFYNHTKQTTHNGGVDLVQKSDQFNIGANLTGSQLTSLNIGAKIFIGR